MDVRGLVHLIYRALAKEERKLKCAKGKCSEYSVRQLDEKVIHSLIMGEWIGQRGRGVLQHECPHDGQFVDFEVHNGPHRVTTAFEIKSARGLRAFYWAQADSEKLRGINFPANVSLYSVMLAWGTREEVEAVRSKLPESQCSTLLALNIAGELLIVGVLSGRDIGALGAAA